MAHLPRMCGAIIVFCASVLLVLIPAACANNGSTSTGDSSADSATVRSQDPNISVEDAQSVLTHAEDLAEAGDESALCDMGGSVGICHDFLQDVGGVQTVPTSRPVTIGTRVMPDLYCGEKLAVVGGRVLAVKGVDISGNGYNTDFMVMRWNGKLVPYNPVYWSGMRMSTPNINCQTGGASGSTSGTPTSP